MADKRPTLTVKATNIPQTAVAKDLFAFLEAKIGEGSIFAVEIFTVNENWKSKGYGRVQFDTPQQKLKALSLSDERKLKFGGSQLSLSHSLGDIIARPVEPVNRVDKGEETDLYVGIMAESNRMGILESWSRVKLWVMPERERIEFFVEHNGECYKMEVGFGDVVETRGCCLKDREKKEVDAVLLKLKFAPKIYRKVSGPDVASRFSTNRYRICKEDFDFIWVRTTDFSSENSIGYMSSLCWKVNKKSSSPDVHTSLPYYQKDTTELILEKSNKKFPPSNMVPIVSNPSVFKVDYEVLYQLNSLVHAQKMSLSSVDAYLFLVLSKLDAKIALSILQKMHKSQSFCYDPLSFIKTESTNTKNATSNKPANQNMMNCHRVLVTPSKIFCVGPELETSNYIVKHFSSYGSDFLRVTFVDEDWGRLSAGAVSATIKQGIFAKQHKTEVYHRILKILRDGILIGEKNFQFLAFSASQLRSNSVWMFASNDQLKADDIREWMGRFDSIRSVSKCAARMGQLFSSSTQTIEVHPRDVDLIPDIEAVSPSGVNYCFSDGIGKISYTFASDICRKMGISRVPSAFQIRYGGYKGVIAVDAKSFKKISLRSSMQKFESDNRMLNVTKCSDSMPCYLNREIITLFSTLGVSDDAFLSLQEEHLKLLAKVLMSRGAALNVLETIGSEMKGVLGNMLRRGYEPREEPFLFMMLKSFLENQLLELRSRCRIFVPKGRVLVGCLDETGILEYGQVFVRLTLTKTELESRGRESKFFQEVDGTTSVVKGRVVVTKNPCLHPGDVRVLEAVWDVRLRDGGMTDCLVFPKKGERPHPNECSGGDLDGDQYFISWDENLIPNKTVPPMDYTGRKPRIMNHNVTLEEIQRFFVDYMINDTLGAISTAHLVHADREPEKALSPKCLELATLHSAAVDFAKTGSPAEMPRFLRIREYPDFMERWEKPMYISEGALGKIYRATISFLDQTNPDTEDDSLEKISAEAYDKDLIVNGYEDFLTVAETHKEQYLDKMITLMRYYGAESEAEILSGNLNKKCTYLKHDNRRYGEVKDRILVSVKSLIKETKGWFDNSGFDSEEERKKLACAWYHVTYHPSYSSGSGNCLGFPWVVGDVLLEVKANKSSAVKVYTRRTASV